jgi:hypothetical protein
MATAAIGIFNENSLGLNFSDLVVFAIGGLSSFAVTDYIFPNAGNVESSITSFLGDIPFVGSLWGAAEGTDSVVKAVGSLSFLLGILAGMAGKLMTGDGSFGLLLALAAGSMEALVVNGTFSSWVPTL